LAYYNCFQDKRKVLIWRGFFEVIA